MNDIHIPEKDYKELSKLIETFDLLALRLDRVMPQSAESAFDHWREVIYFTLNRTYSPEGIPPFVVEQARAAMDEVVFHFLAAGVTVLPQ